MRVELTKNTLDLYVAKGSLVSALISTFSILLLWGMGGAKVTVAILFVVTALTMAVAATAKPARGRRPGLPAPTRPAAL